MYFLIKNPSFVKNIILRNMNMMAMMAKLLPWKKFLRTCKEIKIRKNLQPRVHTNEVTGRHYSFRASKMNVHHFISEILNSH